MNSENLSYFPGFMLIGDRDCVSSCQFRLSRTSENLPYFPEFRDEWLSRLCFALKLSTVDI